MNKKLKIFLLTLLITIFVIGMSLILWLSLKPKEDLFKYPDLKEYSYQAWSHNSDLYQMDAFKTIEVDKAHQIAIMNSDLHGQYVVKLGNNYNTFMAGNNPSSLMMLKGTEGPINSTEINAFKPKGTNITLYAIAGVFSFLSLIAIPFVFKWHKKTK